MKNILIIGSGISGLSCAIECANKGMSVTLVSPFPSERSQSVLAAGGINAVNDNSESDSFKSHAEDTLKGGCYIAGEKAVKGLVEDAPDVIAWLESLGTVFTRDEDSKVSKRAFGGQSHKRTCFCGASTGKQIVSALVMETRRLEGLGLINRRLWTDFHSALIRDGKCYGAIVYNEAMQDLELIKADALVIATGGQNALFGKTTGSTQCDGYVAGKLFLQGVELKNLEFIQYHPTTLETEQKNMLISEAARGEGGRLFYEEEGKRVYFMEEKFGEMGNLMPRDIVSKCIYECGKPVFLDVSFLGKELIMTKLSEIYDLCMKYKGLDITKEAIPVTPSVHFFMGGIAVKNNHETNVENLYAIGECASIYHGANRLGGNSLLAAIHSARLAAKSIDEQDISKHSGSVISTDECNTALDNEFEKDLANARKDLKALKDSKSQFPVMYIRDIVAENLKGSMGIVRTAEGLEKGIEDIDYYISVADKIHYDRSELAYFSYSLGGILALAKAALTCALFRCESRGAHLRKDYPNTRDDYKAATIISYDDGKYRTYLDFDKNYEE